MNYKKAKLTKRLERLVIEAAEYCENGDPYKDAMDDCDVAELICYAAKVIKINNGDSNNG